MMAVCDSQICGVVFLDIFAGLMRACIHFDLMSRIFFFESSHCFPLYHSSSPRECSDKNQYQHVMVCHYVQTRRQGQEALG